MFVTQSSFPPMFTTGTGSNAVERADALCNADPQAAGSTYKAIIVDSNLRRACLTANCSGENEGIDWVLKPNQEYRLTDRTRVVATTNAKALLPDPLTGPLMYLALTENAGPSILDMPDAWSGLKSDWTVGDNCSNWTSDSFSVNHLSWHPWEITNYLARSGTCDRNRSLICVGTTPPEPDTTPPTPGTALSLDTATASSLDVYWGNATDNVTPQNSLEYKLVKGASLAAIDTVEEADSVAGGDLLMDWDDENDHDVTGLSPDTEYYFAVLVRDAAGNKALYTPKAFSTLEPTLRIFTTQAQTQPDFAAGSGATALAKADDICMDDARKPNGSNYKALIAHSTDRRACTAANCSGASGTEQGVNWVLQPNTTYVRVDGSTVIGTTNANGIFSFPLTNSISTQTTLIITGIKGDWTTGDNCANWASNSSEDVTNLGVDEETSSTAIFDPSDQGACNFVTRPIYCVEQPISAFPF